MTAATFAWPFYGFFALFPLEALRVMFGPQWDAAAPLVPIFCAAGAVAILWYFTLSMLVAVGKVHLMMQAELIIQTFRIGVFIFCGYVVGTIESFAYGLLVVYAVNILVAYGFKQMAISFETGLMIRALAHALAVSLLTLGPALFLRILIDLQVIELNKFVTFFVAGALTAVAWPIALRLLRHPLWEDAFFREIRQRLRAVAP